MIHPQNPQPNYISFHIDLTQIKNKNKKQKKQKQKHKNKEEEFSTLR